MVTGLGHWSWVLVSDLVLVWFVMFASSLLALGAIEGSCFVLVLFSVFSHSPTLVRPPFWSANFDRSLVREGHCTPALMI